MKTVPNSSEYSELVFRLQLKNIVIKYLLKVFFGNFDTTFKFKLKIFIKKKIIIKKKLKCLSLKGIKINIFFYI